MILRLRRVLFDLEKRKTHIRQPVYAEMLLNKLEENGFILFQGIRAVEAILRGKWCVYGG